MFKYKELLNTKNYSIQSLGCNNNKLVIWNTHSTTPVLKFTSHIAAVKTLT